jgi:hypothetical protein
MVEVVEREEATTTCSECFAFTGRMPIVNGVEGTAFMTHPVFRGS